MHLDLLTLRFFVESTPHAAFEARRALSVLADVLPGETYSDLKLVVSELVANGAEHGPGSLISGSIELHPDGTVQGSVRDGGDDGVEIDEDAEPGTGLGLRIVDALAARWAVRPGTTDVWFELVPPEPDLAFPRRETNLAQRTACEQRSPVSGSERADGRLGGATRRRRG
jgi:hypothetical protein